MANIFTNTNPYKKPNTSYSASDPAATIPALKTPAAKTYVQNQIPKTTQTATPAVTTDNTEKIKSVQSQIADLTAQADALKKAGLTDTSEISKNATGGYEQNATGSYNKALTSYTDAYKKYIESLNPSEETTAAQQAYNNYVAEQQKSISGLAGKDAAVPLSIVRGQQEKLLGQTQPEATRLQNEIGIAQTADTSRQNVGLAGVSLQEKLLGLQQSPAEQAKNNQIQLGDVLYEKQADGSYKQIAGQEKLDTSVVEVGGSKVLIDNQTGSIIRNLGSSGTGTSYSGVYTQGDNPIVDAWAERIQNGTSKITDIPASQSSLRNAVTVALQAMGNSSDGRPTTTELGKAALSNAESLMKKFDERRGTGAVGGPSVFNWATIPGSDRSDFINDFNAVKSQLSLEGVKYLKGQGQVSDAERALLGQAVTKLNLSQSEKEFKSTLQGIIDKLKGNESSSNSGVTSSGISYTIE